MQATLTRSHSSPSLSVLCRHLALQGGLDPLNDAKGRTRDLAALCPDAMVNVIDAGHCPHDEQPEKVCVVVFALFASDI